MTHIAEIIAVGTELLLGNTANTDAQMLSEGLSALGINVYYHTVVGDNPERLRAAVAIAKSRADVIITTGGLGPTFDDLTKQTVAGCFGRGLEYHPELADGIREYFKNLHAHAMPETNLSQAELPERCTVLENTCGTAPGCAFEEDGRHVVMLPGPPRECRSMFYNAAVPYLSRLSDGLIVSNQIRIFGMGESAVEAELRPMMERMTNPTLAPYAKEGEVMLRVTAKAATEREGRAMLEPVVEKLKEKFGALIYGVDVDSLEQVVVEALKERRMTLSAAESCTGGLLQKRVTDISGSSEVFVGGVVSYSNEFKHNILGVGSDLLQRYGAVSEPVARAMAEGARRISGADVAVGITGIAGPNSDDSEKPVGLVYVALSAADRQECLECHFGLDRERNRTAAANTALDMVRRYLLGI